MHLSLAICVARKEILGGTGIYNQSLISDTELEPGLHKVLAKSNYKPMDKNVIESFPPTTLGFP